MAGPNFTTSNMENYVENILAENLTLKRKLDSKCEALVILNKELRDCAVEKQQYKLLAEQLQKKLSSVKRSSFSHNSFAENQEDCLSNSHESRETNKNLVFEVESLRQKLRDALGDIKALRTKLNQKKLSPDPPESTLKQMDKEEELVRQLEAMNIVKNQLEMDLQSVVDEKEELINERDAYKCKIHRLNHEFNMLLKGGNHNIIDLDSLIMENRFLQENLQQAQEEIKLANQTVNRFKEMVENRRGKSSIKLCIDNLSEALLSQKQVQDLVQILSTDAVSNSSVSTSDLKSICLTLLENLNDKTLALVHQRKTNRILASRLYELEQRIGNAERSSVCTFPSKILLEGYVGSEVDKVSAAGASHGVTGQCVEGVGRVESEDELSVNLENKISVTDNTNEKEDVKYIQKNMKSKPLQ